MLWSSSQGISKDLTASPFEAASKAVLASSREYRLAMQSVFS
jgi:hypothetical protein